MTSTSVITPETSQPKTEEGTTTPQTCSSPNCTKPASSLKCPVCVKLNLTPSYFCSQSCFKLNYKQHTLTHKHAKELEICTKGLASFKVPKFNYTGDLRPSFVTPMRRVPASIPKPDYALNGIPISEMRSNRDRPKHIPIYTCNEISGIRQACKLGREVLDIIGHEVRPGITTEALDIIVHDECIKRNCYPSPLNYHNFPKSCCTSVNEVICHGIPDCRPLENGDIVNIDITVFYDGFHGDLNETFLVGNVEQKYKDLVKYTYLAMMNSIEKVKPNVMCRKFGEIIENTVRKHGFQVVRTYCGHGIGRMFHCNPNIPHYRRNKAVGKLKPGMIFTIEPMINCGSWKDQTWSFDNWTSTTIDGKRSAQYEHTILVTDDGYEILTERTDNSLPFWWENEDEVDVEIEVKSNYNQNVGQKNKKQNKGRNNRRQTKQKQRKQKQRQKKQNSRQKNRNNGKGNSSNVTSSATNDNSSTN